MLEKSIKSTKLRRGRRRFIRVTSRNFIRTAKALVVSKLIAIFYTGHGKS
jgi:hypothetical protein